MSNKLYDLLLLKNYKSDKTRDLLLIPKNIKNQNGGIKQNYFWLNKFKLLILSRKTRVNL